MNNEMFAIKVKQTKYTRILKQLGATSADKSINLQEYGLRKSLSFNKLLREGIIIQTYHNRYYIDVSKEEEQRRRKQVIVIMMVIFILSALVMTLITIDYFSGGKALMIEKW